MTVQGDAAGRAEALPAVSYLAPLYNDTVIPF